MEAEATGLDCMQIRSRLVCGIVARGQRLQLVCDVALRTGVTESFSSPRWLALLTASHLSVLQPLAEASGDLPYCGLCSDTLYLLWQWLSPENYFFFFKV